MASGANDTLRFASDFLRASRRDSFSLSFSSRSLAVACCSSSVRRETRVSFTGALSVTLNGSGDPCVAAAVGVGVPSKPKSIKGGACWASNAGGAAFSGLAFLAGISRKADIVGLRIDLGGGRAAAASD